ncbi:MAG: hypothetical protein K0S99_3796, partial [Thermomicrobiales bacterium]|nr:hypothetical protein [Thermomicrobiales bacterium]
QCPELASLFIPLVDRMARGPDPLNARQGFRIHQHPLGGSAFRALR